MAFAAEQAVAAGTAIERVVTATTAQHVVAAVAGDPVVEIVAGAVDGAAAAEGESVIGQTKAKAVVAACGDVVADRLGRQGGEPVTGQITKGATAGSSTWIVVGQAERRSAIEDFAGKIQQQQRTTAGGSAISRGKTSCGDAAGTAVDQHAEQPRQGAAGTGVNRF